MVDVRSKEWEGIFHLPKMHDSCANQSRVPLLCYLLFLFSQYYSKIPKCLLGILSPISSTWHRVGYPHVLVICFRCTYIRTRKLLIFYKHARHYNKFIKLYKTNKKANKYAPCFSGMYLFCGAQCNQISLTQNMCALRAQREVHLS